MKDPVARTASPYTDPNVKGPHSKIVSSGNPSDLRKSASCYPGFVSLAYLTLADLNSVCSDCQQR
jgi:hypothetical protein